MDRRCFLSTAASAACAVPVLGQEKIPIIDIHQHTNYSDRSDDALVAHQRKMGITKTILLPAGRRYGLAAKAFGNDSVVAVSKKYPKEFVFCANELPDIPETRSVIEKYLKMGAIGIAEQKFPVDADSKHMQLIADIAKEYKVPVLMHFQHETYNYHYERFHTMLAKYPQVNFIGHAQTFWANISKVPDAEQKILYPKTKVIPGGITDRLLKDYPNMYADLSAGSGHNAFARDPEHGKEFIKRHQDKLIYGSDCNDSVGEGEKCSGSQQILQMKKLANNDPTILHKIFHKNAEKVFRVKV